MSWVFLTDRHVYKLKKPVRHDRLDFRSLERRHHFCREEVRLNRRLAPEVYLGIVPLTQRPDGSLELGGEGKPVDWLVRMRRLPAAQMLDQRIEARDLRREEVTPVALRLARFYAGAQPVETSPADYRARLEAGIREDLRELGRPEFGLDKDRVGRLAEAQLAWLAQHADDLAQRVAAGRVIEGHGDLRPEHVCLAPPVVIDCLEFSRELRILDPADELAFLGLECERLGAPEVGAWFLEVYRRESGDAPPEPLLRFHRAYRAMRRATIALWHLLDPAVPDADAWRERARRYLELADSPGA